MRLPTLLLLLLLALAACQAPAHLAGCGAVGGGGIVNGAASRDHGAVGGRVGGTALAPPGDPVLWFAAHQEAGATTDTFADQGSLGLDAVSPSGPENATYSASCSAVTAGKMNDHPCWDFDGGDHHIVAAAGMDLLTQPVTVALVGRNTTTSTYFLDGNTAADRLILWKSGGHFEAYADFYVDGPVVDSNMHVLCAQFNSASSVWRVDGADYSADLGVNGLDGLVIGANRVGTADMTGQVYEVLVYNGDEDCTGIEDYFGSRYNEVFPVTP